ncbi:cytochrome P450 [Poronia punctata]|nr:cytochrome P450 [Poronia punctata]
MASAATTVVLDQALRHPFLAASALLFVTAWAVHQVFFAVRYPSSLPRFGGKSRIRLRDRWRFHTDAPSLHKEAYENYSKKGKTVLIPGLAFHDDVVLPPSALKWLQRQPEHLVSASHAQVETIQPFYAFGDDKFVDDPWAGLLIKTDLNLVLENVCAAMNDELAVAIDSHFGTDTDNWREIDLMFAVRMIIAQASSRFTLGGSPRGRELCRNKGYLQTCLSVSDALVTNTGVSMLCPKILRPIFGRLGRIPAQREMRVLEKYFEPVYRERLEMLTQQEDPEDIKDHLHMMFRYGLANRREEVHNLSDMTKRLSLANFGSMHQTSIQVVNMLLNILSSDAEFNTVALLRDEISRVVYATGNNENAWTKSKVAAMTRADSAARETMRTHPFGSRSVNRTIVAEGVVTEDGIPLPKGANVSVLSYWSQNDSDVVENPEKFDPFRYSRIREAAEMNNNNNNNNNTDNNNNNKNTNLGQLSFVSLGPQHLSFSYGKHACPGRFLVDFELKMVIAHMLRNYDIELAPEHNGKRPENVFRTEVHFPPDVAKIRVRRRVDKN